MAKCWICQTKAGWPWQKVFAVCRLHQQMLRQQSSQPSVTGVAVVPMRPGLRCLPRPWPMSGVTFRVTAAWLTITCRVTVTINIHTWTRCSQARIFHISWQNRHKCSTSLLFVKLQKCQKGNKLYFLAMHDKLWTSVSQSMPFLAIY